MNSLKGNLDLVDNVFYETYYYFFKILVTAAARLLESFPISDCYLGPDLVFSFYFTVFI